MLLGPLSSALRVHALATINVDIAAGLAAGQTVGGVALAVDYLVVLTGQTAPAENGVYEVPRAGIAPRHKDFKEFANLVGMSFQVMMGTNADTLWLCTNDPGGVLEVTAITIALGDDVAGDLADHIANVANPHAVTQAQVGLGSVNNTSDADKPVSTAQQTALDAKVAKAGDTMTGALIAPSLQASIAAAEALIAINSDIGQLATLALRSAGVARWLLNKDTDAEAGSNAGSNLELSARADDGTLIGLIFDIVRATRILDFKVSPTAPTPTLGDSSAKVANMAAVAAAVAAGITGLQWKTPVRALVTTDTAIATALENGDTFDGLTLATNDRVALTGQTAPAENGIYIVPASGVASRATDMDAPAEFPNAAFLVTAGTKAGTQWKCNNTSNPTLGVTAIVLEQIGAGLLLDYASQAEAEAGVNSTKVMTPLTTAQAIDAQVITLPVMATTTLAALAAIGNAINTSGKIKWRVVADENDKLWFALGSTAGSKWRPFDDMSSGLSDITPV